MKHLTIAAWICLVPLAHAEDVMPASAPISQPQVHVAAPDPQMMSAVYLYSKAAYAQEVMRIRNCDQIDASKVGGIDQRLANARIKMQTLYGRKVLRAMPPVTPAIPGNCDGIQIANYGDQVTELEKSLKTTS